LRNVEIQDMARQRRYIQSNTPYEICFRARDSLPFVAYKVIALFIKSAIARAQRDDKVILCHDVWEGSHPHMIVVTKDSQQCVNFYTEVQKKITDYLKALLGLNELQIWEGRPTVNQIDDLETAKEKIAYLYANPAQDNIAPSIERFIGYSSWNEYQLGKESFGALSEEAVPWIRLPSIPALPSRTLTRSQDAGLVTLLSRTNKKRHVLRRAPNAWMKCFQVESDKEVEEINNEILGTLREKEKDAAILRVQEKKELMPVSIQRYQEILKPHTPKKKGRKIHFQTSCNIRRLQILQFFREFNQLCRDCYEEWKKGNYTVQWPPGAFKPPLPATANALPST